MLIDILTLFPSMFSGPFEESIIKRAQERGLVEIKIHNLRDWTKDKHKTVDDRPFGGGPGMVLMCQPIFDAVEGLLRRKSHPERPRAAVEGESRDPAKRWMRRLRRLDSSALPRNDRIGKTSIALLTPQGQVFNQETARRLSKLDHLILICGHYEGVDERVREHLVEEEISIGDYVLTGGELPSMVVVDAIVRLIPGVLEKPEAIESESFSQAGLEFPQYTRPENFRGLKVPEILLSGNHQEIEKWRREQSLKRTKNRRPDLFRRKMK